MRRLHLQCLGQIRQSHLLQEHLELLSLAKPKQLPLFSEDFDVPASQEKLDSLLVCVPHPVWCPVHVPMSLERPLFGSAIWEYLWYPYAIAINYTIATSAVAVADDIANAFNPIVSAIIVAADNSFVAIGIASVVVLLLDRSAQLPKSSRLLCRSGFCRRLLLRCWLGCHQQHLAYRGRYSPACSRLRVFDSRPYPRIE